MHVEFCGVARRFGHVLALAGVDLVLPSGSRTAVIGPNGSGKSTLTRALLGLIPHEGEILLDGRPRQLDDPVAARGIAYVPQVTPRLAAHVGEIVAAVSSLRGIDPARVAEFAASLGLSLPEIERRPLRNLSGGMRQKVLAAIALASQPPLLVLDEPTASMDPRSRRAFFEAVDALPRTTTVLLCSHRLDEIRSLVDRIVVMAEGLVRFSGAADEHLRERSASLVEVRAADSAATALGELGFRHGATGWWSRAVPAVERAELVRQVVLACGEELVDVLATDLEDVSRGAPTAQPHHQEAGVR